MTLFVVALCLLIAVHALINYSRIGRAMRAVSENPALARLAGVDVEATIRFVWLLGGALAAAAGVMLGLLVQIRPFMGFDLLLPLFAAAILGGVGSAPGAFAGALIVGLAEAITVQLAGAEWRAAVAFANLDRRAAHSPDRPRREAAVSFDPGGVLAYASFFFAFALINAIVCLGLNLQWGMTGLFNVGVAGFVAIGAYVSALMTTPPSDAHLGGFALPIGLGWLTAMLASGAASAAVGALTLRLRADYLAIVTFGVAVVTQLVALNAQRLTGGAFGIAFIPRPFEAWAAQPLAFNAANLGLIAAVVVVLYAALERLARAPWGRVLRAIREDERAAMALGKSPRRYRLQAFALGGALMGLGGAIEAHFIGFIAPENFLSGLTFQIWAMLIVGGAGSNLGAIVGAVVVWALWSGSGLVIADFVAPTFEARAAALRLAAIGAALAAMIVFRPRGLIGEGAFASKRDASEP